MMTDQQANDALRALVREPVELSEEGLRAVVAAIPDTPQQRSPLLQLPTWRFQSMFSATKFVVAGAILALFGGILLTGVLTQQPSDDRLPVGASASATAQADPTEAASSEPEPTTEAEADDTATATDLLPGVDLVTEEVEPGVYRVLSDGVRDLTRRVQDVAVTPTGDVWVEQGTSRDWDIIRLGEPDVSRTLGREDPWFLFTLDGAPTVTQPAVAPPPTPWRTFDGERWVDHEPTGCDYQQRWGQGGITADGQCWAQLPYERGVYPIDDSGDAPRDDFGQARSVVLDGVGSTADRFMSSADVTDDGTLWATVHSSATSNYEGLVRFEGLVRYDGETWDLIPYDAALEPEAETWPRYESHIALGPDGRVWTVDIYHPPAGNKSAFVVRVWDGEDWMTLGPVEAPRRFGSPRTDARFLDDGSVWLLDGWLVVDDDGLRTQDLPGVPGDVEFGPDGSAWTIAGRALYVITPEAVQ